MTELMTKIISKTQAPPEKSQTSHHKREEKRIYRTVIIFILYIFLLFYYFFNRVLFSLLEPIQDLFVILLFLIFPKCLSVVILFTQPSGLSIRTLLIYGEQRSGFFLSVRWVGGAPLPLWALPERQGLYWLLSLRLMAVQIKYIGCRINHPLFRILSTPEASFALWMKV